MDRRKFIQVSGGVSLLFALPSSLAAGQKDGFTESVNRAQKIPVINETDVLIFGGSIAAIASAIAISEKGLSVMVISKETYFGEDIAGTLRYFDQEGKAPESALGKLLFGSEGHAPTPLDFKRTLDNVLIERGIPFLFSSFVADILRDKNGSINGAIIANRSGVQAIYSKIIIDATPRATFAHLAGAVFESYPKGKYTFKTSAAGIDLEPIKGLTARSRKSAYRIREGKWASKAAEANLDFVEYEVDVEMKDGSFASHMEAWNTVRDKTWHPAQSDAADYIFQIPPDRMSGAAPYPDAEWKMSKAVRGAFKPKNFDGIYVLSSYADVNRAACNQMLIPDNFIQLGEHVGQWVIEDLTKIKQGKLSTKARVQRDQSEPGFSVVSNFIRDQKIREQIEHSWGKLPVLGEFDVVVAGGGTAGACAAIGSAREGASTVVLEYMPGLGGVGTVGAVCIYWDGYRHGFTKEVTEGSRLIGGGHIRGEKGLKAVPDGWIKDWKMEWLRREIRNAGGNVWLGCGIVGAIKKDNRITGVVIATDEGLGIVMGNTIIDSTGSADVAVAAGVPFDYTNGNTVAVQGAGIAPWSCINEVVNTDFTFIDDTDVYDITRTFVVGRSNFRSSFDLGKFLQTRERRRIHGDTQVGVLDIINGRKYSDVISMHQASFDSHGFTEHPYLSIINPKEREFIYLTTMPFRALLPIGLDGIIVTGLGASVDRDAMPVMRMQACLQNQGYAVGLAAAQAAKTGKLIREVELRPLQKQLVLKGNLPPESLEWKEQELPTPVELVKAMDTVFDDMNGIQTLLWNPTASIPLLKDRFPTLQKKEDRVTYGLIMGFYGVDSGWKDLIGAIKEIEKWDVGWHFRGHGYGPRLSRLDKLIIALGRTRRVEALDAIFEKSKLLRPESEFSHFRAVCEALGSIKSKDAAPILESILNLPGIQGHHTENIKESLKDLVPETPGDNSTRNNSLKEIFLARALCECSDPKGLGKRILNQYANDVRGHYARHAKGILAMT